MGTDTDQIAALISGGSTRRSTKPTPHDRDEGLIPYAEVLPIFANSWVTTKHQVRRLRKIATAAASLESTVLCFAHGLDLFYTRLHPSRSYDMLDDEFSYLLLILTLAASPWARSSPRASPSSRTWTGSGGDDEQDVPTVGSGVSTTT